MKVSSVNPVSASSQKLKSRFGISVGLGVATAASIVPLYVMKTKGIDRLRKNGSKGTDSGSSEFDAPPKKIIWNGLADILVLYLGFGVLGLMVDEVINHSKLVR